MAWKPWWDSGFVHGFSLRPQNYGAEDEQLWGQKFCAAFSVEKLLLPKQLHGTRCLELDSALISSLGQGLQYVGEGDALCINKLSGSKGALAIGVKSADCVPLLVRTEHEVAVIHAGWKGIAAGIAEKVIARLLERTSNIEVLLGPCAGESSYEVGEQVLQEIGTHAVFINSTHGRLLLDLRGTISNSIYSSFGINCICNPECTILNTQFHSHRRDGVNAGRNLNFIVL